MRFKFEKLEVWQRAMDLGEILSKAVRKFPKEEQYNLVSQLCRASDSVALNISEGSIGQTNSEQKRFLGYAIRSLAEVVTCLYKAKLRNYISEVEFNQYYDQSYNLLNMLIAFRKSIKSID